MSNPIVQVAQGKLKGREAKDLKKRTYYSFQGIPYAKPPLGKLRFKAPQPAEPWNGVLDATNVRNSCYCRQIITDVVGGSEDCLFVNVYTPKLPKGDKVSLPVMFFVHGGGFYTGSGDPDFYGPEYLVSEDVVLVTFNYRLGALGFLSLPDPSLEVTGNAGLKDMVLALKWVQQNISNFGGDPNNVTIFGESAGSASVHFLILSPSAKGLFHKAIGQSGVVFNPWVGSQPNCVERLVKYLNIDAKDNKTVLQGLQSVPVEKLLDAQTECMKNADKYIGDLSTCGPTVEVPSPNAFISQPYEDIIRKGTYNQVPLILGYNTYEGVCMMMELDKEIKQSVKPDFTDSELLVPRFLNLKRGSAKSKEVGDKIKQFYYGNEVPSEKNISKFIDIFTDVFFLQGIYESAKGHIQTSSQPVYFYQFDLVTELNLINKLFPDKHIPGATHADELTYLFTNSVLKDYELKPGSPEQIGVHRVLKLWTNFAKTGNPNSSPKDPQINVEWKPATKNDFTRLVIGENLKIEKEPALDRMKFWEELLKSQKINIVF